MNRKTLLMNPGDIDVRALVKHNILDRLRLQAILTEVRQNIYVFQRIWVLVEIEADTVESMGDFVVAVQFGQLFRMAVQDILADVLIVDEFFGEVLHELFEIAAFLFNFSNLQRQLLLNAHIILLGQLLLQHQNRDIANWPDGIRRDLFPDNVPQLVGLGLALELGYVLGGNVQVTVVHHVAFVGELLDDFELGFQGLRG